MWSAPGRRDRPRKYSDDEEDGGQSKRSRVEYTEYNEQVARGRLEDLIIQLGNNSSIEQHETVQNDVHDMSMVLEGEIAKFKDAILEVLVACASERLDKLRVYATLIGLINLKNQAFVGEFLEQLVKCLRDELQLQSGTDWDCVMCTVRFLAELTSYRVVSPASMLQLYTAFVGVTLEEGIPQARSDCFVHLVLASMPWTGGQIAEKHRQELTQLLASIDSYRARRSLLHLRAVQSLAGQEDWIDSLWHQIQSLEKSDWKEKCTVRYEALSALLASPEAVCHSLPAMAPQPHEDGAEYPFPRAVFRLFDYTDVPEDGAALPGEHSIERYLVEESLSVLIACNWHDRKSCTKALLNARFGVRVPLSYMITELALGQMLRLPNSERLQLFYGSLIIELCKEDPETMPNVVAQATFGLFDRIDGMNAECVHRLARWFSYHLSQCKYQWDWKDWTDECQSLPGDHPKRVFLRETAQLVLRFSFYDHVKKMFGQQLAPLLLHQKPPECVYKYDNEADYSPEIVACAHKLIDAIRDRCTPDRAIEVLNELPRPSVGEAGDSAGVDEAHLLLKVDVFFSTLLFLGSKSFSHSFAALAKFNPVCKALVPVDAPDSMPAKLRLLTSLYDCWRWHEQMLSVLLDKLVKVQLVDCESVFRWLFGGACLPPGELTRGFVWDVAESTLAKMCKQCAKLREDSTVARRQYDAYQERMREGGAVGAGDPATEDGDNIPTRDELDDKLARSERADGELKRLVECLVRSGVGGVGGGATEHLEKLLRDRCTAVLTMHFADVRQSMRELRSEAHKQQQQQAGEELETFFQEFFSLSD